ncbi:MAG: hypothetical protein GY737_25525 [Desulfobacteraceae bacterium]|nr:hypothetical protein [Desulfobacteraceae bacterium]
MPSNYGVRLLFVGGAIGLMAVVGLLLKGLLVPDSFGVYGSYRADAIVEEAEKPIRHGTNASCFACHPYEAKSHKNGLHARISCEFCHGTHGDHAKGNKKIGTLPVKKNREITTLCLRCHNNEIKARPEQVIKTVAMPQHLEVQKVKLTHTCNQCHYVHAPLQYINKAKQITGIQETTL